MIMKNVTKFAVVAACVLMASNAMAQEPNEKGNITTEVQFNPFANSFNTFKLEGLKARYFLTDVDAVRVNLGFNVDKNTMTENGSLNDRFEGVTNYSVGSSELATKTTETTFRIGVGYERHLVQRDRISLYAGAEIGYEGIFRSGEQTYTENGERLVTYGTTTTVAKYSESHNVSYDKMMPAGNYLPGDASTGQPSMSGKFNEHNFFASVFTGIDFQVYKGIYIGTEFGIRFTTGDNRASGSWTQNYSSTNVSTSGSTVNTTTTQWSYSSASGVCEGLRTNSVSGSTPTETKIQNAYTGSEYTASSTNLKIYIEPALRLGWRF